MQQLERSIFNSVTEFLLLLLLLVVVTVSGGCDSRRLGSA